MPVTSTARAQSAADESKPAPAAAAPAPAAGRTGRLKAPLRKHAMGIAICLAYVVAAFWLTHGLWPDPATRTFALNPEDQTLIEWFLANDVRLLVGDVGLVNDRINAPDGYNMMVNATIILIGVLFAPVTAVFGAPVSFALLTAGNLAATAIAWYLLLRRTLGVGRLAAGVAAAFCGFGPGMVSQANSHPHMTAQWLVPAMVWCVIRLARAADRDRPEGGPGALRRIVVAGLVLALLVVLQVFTGEEVVFLTAVTLLLFSLVYAALRPRWAWRVLPRFALGLAVTAVAAGVLLAYPLWVQFAGPQSVPNGVFSPDYFSADLASFPAISPLSLAGTEAAARLSTGPSEYNTFLGLALILVVVAAVVWLWRRPAVVAAAVVGLVMAWLSLGPSIVVDGERTGIWAPYELLRGVPAVEGALPMRFALPLIPLIAVILAIALDQARSLRPPASVLVPAAVIAALLPIAPTPFPTTDRARVPEFISGGDWRRCVEPGGVLVPVPLPTPKEPDAMRWAAAAGARFALPEGFFIGPYGRNGHASIGTFKQPTSALLAEVAATGKVPVVSPAARDQATKDAAFWGASCLVLARDEPNAGPLRNTVDLLYGPATAVSDVWIWKL
jgi:hypothetical protein